MSSSSRWAVISLVLVSSSVFAQDGGRSAPQEEVLPAGEGAAPSAAVTGGTFALSAGVLGSGSGNIGILYFLGPSSAVHLSFSSTLGIIPFALSASFDLGYRMYLGKQGPVALFAQPSFGIGYGQTVFSFGISAGVGLEYFLAERLSTGVIASLGLRTENLFQAMTLSTASSSLFLNIYF